MLKVDKITFQNNGKLINYQYSFSNDIKKFFNRNSPFFVEFKEDVSSVPYSINVIPFLSNVMPIAWFAGFDVLVRELDEDFYLSLDKIKQEFTKYFPNKNISGKLIVGKVIKNKIKKNKENDSVMLFSGGVDSFSTFIRTLNKKPNLVTYQGADIPINDVKQWNNFTQYIESQKLLSNNKKIYIKSNFREFYTYRVELLLDDIGWWGIVQHGLALLGSMAPIAFKNNINSIYIASSYTDEIEIFRGSMPTIDEEVSWAGLKVFHEGYDLRRQDKVDLIVDYAIKNNSHFPIRVCYSESRNGFNCSNCEKCFRTILGIILNNDDPNKYGFKTDNSIYKKTFDMFSYGDTSEGVKYYFWELMEKAKKNKPFFIFSDKPYEEKQMNLIRMGELDKLMSIKSKKIKKRIKRLRFLVTNKFPALQNIYRKIKYTKI